MRVIPYVQLESKKGIRWSRTYINQLVERGGFPRPISLGPRTKGWLESEIDAWLEARLAERELAVG